MFIVDGQIHIGAPNSAAQPWVGDAWQKHRSDVLNAEGSLKAMDEAGVARAVLVPVSWDEGRGNAVALEAVRMHPDRFAIMGKIDIDDPASKALIAGWRERRQMLGVRVSFTRDTRHWASDGTADWLWPALEEAGMPVMVLAPGSVKVIGAIAARHPRLKIIMDHMALETRGRKGDAAFWETPDLLELARMPNVAVKASALSSYTEDAFPYPVLHRYIRQVYDAYGPRRMFWGSDLSRLRGSYRDYIRLFTEELPWLTATDKEWIMGRGLCEWIGWPLPSA